MILTDFGRAMEVLGVSCIVSFWAFLRYYPISERRPALFVFLLLTIAGGVIANDWISIVYLAWLLVLAHRHSSQLEVEQWVENRRMADTVPNNPGDLGKE